MRLINVHNMALEFFPGKLPQYAVLSHTWTDEELSFQEFSHSTPPVRSRGYHKITKACQLAAEDGLSYVWVDTCCIDKTSSAELSEAINSMYAWYAGSQMAFAFLEDWDGDVSQLEKCRWFTRGWTLQELIAPANLKFYNAKYIYAGTKHSLRRYITSITGIAEEVLQGLLNLRQIPVAVRMSWAAGRDTTRVEDVAYSLLGLFQINMPMLYGEGKRAFMRLQEAIVADINDPTLFAWKAPPEPKAQDFRGIFAHNPDEFSSTTLGLSSGDLNLGRDFALTNKGVRTLAGVCQMWGGRTKYVLNLGCLNKVGSQLGITLFKYGSSLFARQNPTELELSEGPRWVLKKPQTVFIAKDMTPEESEGLVRRTDYDSIRFLRGLSVGGFHPISIEPAEQFDTVESKFIVGTERWFTGVIHFESRRIRSAPDDAWHFWLVCGINSSSTGPWFVLSPTYIDLGTAYHMNIMDPVRDRVDYLNSTELKLWNNDLLKGHDISLHFRSSDDNSTPVHHVEIRVQHRNGKEK